MRRMALAYRLCLQSTRGVGPRIARAVCSLVPQYTEARQLGVSEWMALGLKEGIATELSHCLKEGEGERLVERVEKSGVSYVMEEDVEYPALLREIALPPSVLFCLGVLSALRHPCVAVVGTRRATSYGRKAGRDIAASLAQGGVTVVSGLARGIDAAAHEGALTTGKTAAVLGSGVKRMYPAEHEALARRVIEGGGCVVSEFLPWNGPERYHFPRRNRIISGVSSAVIIVEAGYKSGALITASYALEQNRDVYAVPGSIYSSSSDGCNQLLHSGAAPVISARTVCADLGLAPHKLSDATACAPAPEVIPGTDDGWARRLILAELSTGALSLGELSAVQALARLHVSEIARVLTSLELRGAVERDERGCYGLI